MAATDKTYRNQYTRDIVCVLSSILMLFSVVWMFMQDYNREFKEEQRSFRDVEAALAQRLALDQMPNYEQFESAESAVEEAREYRDTTKVRAAIEKLSSDLAKAKEDGAAPEKISDL